MVLATKPTILLVPGSFSEAKHDDSSLDAVRAKGYSIQSVDLRTVGKHPGPLPTMYDDAAYINAAAVKLADEGKEIIIVAHSYGGVPASESLKGVTKAEREKEGKKGGVVRIAYISALVPELGVSAGGHMGAGDKPSGYVVPDEDGWLSIQDTTMAASVVFSSISAERGVEECKRFVQHSSVSFINELTHAGYKDVPASWLFCEEDLCVTPDVQQHGIDNIEKASRRKVDVTRIPADHVPRLSAPEKLADWLVDLIAKGGQ